FSPTSSSASKRFRRRAASIALKRPADTSHALGLDGTPSRGHCSSAALNASCRASSARSKSPSRRISVASTRRDSDWYTASIACWTESAAVTASDLYHEGGLRPHVTKHTKYPKVFLGGLRGCRGSDLRGYVAAGTSQFTIHG